MNLYAIGCSKGQPKRGVDLAPPLFNATFRKHHWDFQSSHTYTDADFVDLRHGLNRVYQEMQSNVNMGLNIAIGGDHSIAAATVAHSLRKYGSNLRVIWIDAHADINTKRTSPSGHFHGMPVASLMNLENSNIIQGFVHYLRAEQLTYIGIRDLDDGEVAFLEKLNIKAFWMKDIVEQGMEHVIAYLQSALHGNPIHISWDVDGLDPKHMPSTGTAVGEGLSMDDALRLCHLFRHQKEHIVGIDLVEVNPTLGTEADVKKTLDNAYTLLHTIVR